MINKFLAIFIILDVNVYILINWKSKIINYNRNDNELSKEQMFSRSPVLLLGSLDLHIRRSNEIICAVRSVDIFFSERTFQSGNTERVRWTIRGYVWVTTIMHTCTDHNTRLAVHNYVLWLSMAMPANIQRNCVQ